MLRLLVSLVLIAVPAVAMGATFPVVARWYVPDAASATRAAGALYAANTVGAALGALLAGFVLLPTVGLRATTWVAVGLNLGVAAAAWMLAAGRVAEPVATPAEDMAARQPRVAAARPRRRCAVAGSGARGSPRRARGVGVGIADAPSGLVAAAAHILGPTTYAFSLVVAVFIAGLALGAVAGRWLANRVAQPAAGLSLCVSVALLAAIAAASTVDDGLLAIARAVAAPGATFTSVLTRQVLLAAAWLLPLALGLGCAFPFAVRTGTGADASLGADLGLIYAVNTIGAIAGALAAGFILIPRLWLYDTLRGLRRGRRAGGHRSGLAERAVAAGPDVGHRGRSQRRGGQRSAAGVEPGTAVERRLQVCRDDDRPMRSNSSLAAGRLLYFREAPAPPSPCGDAAGTTSLAIDGKVDASNAGDMLTQRLLAHVPLLLHPAPRQAAILGLGSGVTLGSALRHPLERVDVLEIRRRWWRPRASSSPRTRGRWPTRARG